MDFKTEKISDVPGILGTASKFVLWLGSSAGAVTLILTAFGFLVEHARFDQLGVPRNLYEASPTEYVVMGGKFLLALIPMAGLGCFHFILTYWWIALATLLVAALVRWRRWPANWRWLIFAACLALALGFIAKGPWDENAVAMLDFITVAAVIYCYLELTLETESSPLPSRVLSRLPFFALLSGALVALPYLRGVYAISRDYPIVEFLGKDEAFFRELAGVSGQGNTAECRGSLWELIDVGKQRAILRNLCDARIYVVPVSALNTFRIVQVSKEVKKP
jgi:hypothetical protein